MTSVQWKEKLSLVRDSFLASLAETGADGLEALELLYFGRKGDLSLLLRDLKDFPIEERKALGAMGNEIKSGMAAKLAEKKAGLGVGKVSLKTSAFDLTMAGYPFPKGSLHPLTVTINRLTEAFIKLGFSMADGSLMEEDYYNFEALNFPPDHPAREMQDTFYLDLKDRSGKDLLLRTHTSTVEIHTLKDRRPPLRVFHPGRVFRSEAVDASHSFAFHQIEGFYVDKNVSMADLRWTVDAFIKDLFGSSVEVRFMPSYFPFVEPGAEVEMSCVFCKGHNGKCPVCKGSGWIEVLGAGILHPNVMRATGYEPRQWGGFAFGAGIERFAMLLFGISDMRVFYENDLRILKQI
ncbi:MAG TPA: phenylalanine--tRNA ligase subunit alpha [Elusimicrobia bacterium]|nr:phenylalanine--tRNA ligase subunit alpha [Elusimicrobiota bacterium]